MLLTCYLDNTCHEWAQMNITGELNTHRYVTSRGSLNFLWQTGYLLALYFVPGVRQFGKFSSNGIRVSRLLNELHMPQVMKTFSQ